jgi:hypothetical protein
VKSKLLVAVFFIVSVVIVFNEDEPHHNQMRSDACGYYLYLPAIFIYHDLAQLNFYPVVDSQYHHSLQIDYSLHRVNRNTLNKYPLGTSFFELPLFLAAHLYCVISHQYPADGFSLPYQLSVIFSNIFFAVLGLSVLSRFLNKYYTDSIVAITLFCIAFGTNLYAYTGFNPGLSHIYSFFLFSCLIYLTDKWYAAAGNNIISSMIGFTLGLIFVTRPINVLVVIIPVLWNVNSLSALKRRMEFFNAHLKRLIVILFCGFLVAAIQFSYWKYITGHWLFDPYLNEGFNFLHPHIVEGLFSYRKGWFIYTPMAFLALTGLYFLWKKKRNSVPALLIFFILTIYCTFSWGEWWYGGSFGCRPLIESLAFVSLSLTPMSEFFYFSAGKLKKAIYFSLLIFIVFLNIFQTYQYSMGLIHWSRMTKEYYWKVFGKVNFDRAANEQYLIPKTDEKKQ